MNEKSIEALVDKYAMIYAENSMLQDKCSYFEQKSEKLEEQNSILQKKCSYLEEQNKTLTEKTLNDFDERVRKRVKEGLPKQPEIQAPRLPVNPNPVNPRPVKKRDDELIDH